MTIPQVALDLTPSDTPVSPSTAPDPFVRDLDLERRESLRTARGLLLGAALCVTVWAVALGGLAALLAR